MPSNFQVFISYKHTDENGQATRDSQLAAKIYEYLNARGLKVFFAPVTLEGVGASDYSDTIGAALDSATILVIVGTTPGNISSGWVKSEWDTFRNELVSGRKPNGRIFLYVEGLPVNDLPIFLRKYTVIPHGQDSYERLNNYIRNALQPQSGPVEVRYNTPLAQEAKPQIIAPPSAAKPAAFEPPDPAKNAWKRALEFAARNQKGCLLAVSAILVLGVLVMIFLVSGKLADLRAIAIQNTTSAAELAATTQEMVYEITQEVKPSKTKAPTLTATDTPEIRPSATRQAPAAPTTTFTLPPPTSTSTALPSPTSTPTDTPAVSGHLILDEDFDTGSFDPEKNWRHGDNAWYIQNGVMVDNGVNADSSDRYMTWHNLTINETSGDALVISFRGMLMEPGNPQAGRGIILGLVGMDNTWYDLRIENGYTNGPPINPAISFSFNKTNGADQVIIAADEPQRNRAYLVQAIRSGGEWKLYVDETLVGSYADTIGNTRFQEVVLVTVGSVSVDDIKIIAGP